MHHGVSLTVLLTMGFDQKSGLESDVSSSVPVSGARLAQAPREPQGVYLGLSPAALRSQVQKPSWPGCRRLRVGAGVSSEPRTLSPGP